jgi:hypothetical protein
LFWWNTISWLPLFCWNTISGFHCYTVVEYKPLVTFLLVEYHCSGIPFLITILRLRIQKYYRDILVYFIQIDLKCTDLIIF